MDEVCRWRNGMKNHKILLFIIHSFGNLKPTQYYQVQGFRCWDIACIWCAQLVFASSCQIHALLRYLQHLQVYISFIFFLQAKKISTWVIVVMWEKIKKMGLPIFQNYIEPYRNSLLSNKIYTVSIVSSFIKVIHNLMRYIYTCILCLLFYLYYSTIILSAFEGP